jgi:hypothetical protein
LNSYRFVPFGSINKTAKIICTWSLREKRYCHVTLLIYIFLSKACALTENYQLQEKLIVNQRQLFYKEKPEQQSFTLVCLGFRIYCLSDEI